MSTIRHIFILIAGILIVECCLTGDADSATNGDAALVRKTSDNGIFAIRSGQLALQRADTTGRYIFRGDSLDLRHLGRLLIQDHSVAHTNVRELAYMKDIDLRQTLTLSRQRKLDSLSTLQGNAFNMAYLNMVVETHLETIDLLESRLKSIKDEELKIWATSMLPRLENHATMARSMRDSVAVLN